MLTTLRSVVFAIPCFAAAAPQQQKEIEKLCSVLHCADDENVFVAGDQLRHLTTFDITMMKRKQLTPFDRACTGIVDVLSGIPFLAALTVAFVWWCLIRLFKDGGLNLLSMVLGALSLLVTLRVLLGQKRMEKVTSAADAEESLAIRQAVKELQFLHEKLDAVLSRTMPPPGAS